MTVLPLVTLLWAIRSAASPAPAVPTAERATPTKPRAQVTPAKASASAATATSGTPATAEPGKGRVDGKAAGAGPAGDGQPTAEAKAPAPAGPPAPPTDAELRLAKELVAAAQKMFAEGRYADAASRFERAYSVRPVPAILYNLARCHDKLKDVPRALRAYRDYLRQEPKAPDRKKVEASILALEKKLRAQGVSQLIVVTDPPKARVKVDGKDIGEAPASVELVKGPHDVTVALEGYRPVDRVLDIKLEASSLMSVQLEKLPPPPPPTLLPTPVVQAPVMELVEKRKPPNPVPGAISGGAALVSAGVGAYYWTTAEATAKTLRNGNQTGPERDVLYDRAVQQADYANIAFAVAGGAAITAVVLFLVNR